MNPYGTRDWIGIGKRKKLDPLLDPARNCIDLVLIKRLIKQLNIHFVHNDVAACSAWIPYRSGTDYVAVGTDYIAGKPRKLQLYIIEKRIEK